MADNTSETITFECPPNLLEEVDTYVEDSITQENRSQFIRTAMRFYLAEHNENEFSKSQ